MYLTQHNGQLSIKDFHVPFGGTLDPDNRWVLGRSEWCTMSWARTCTPAAQASAQRSRMGYGPGAILGGFGVGHKGQGMIAPVCRQRSPGAAWLLPPPPSYAKTMQPVHCFGLQPYATAPPPRTPPRSPELRPHQASAASGPIASSPRHPLRQLILPSEVDPRVLAWQK